MRHSAETLLGDKFAGLATYAIRLVLDAYKRILQMLYEFKLTRGKLAGLLFGEGCRPLFKHLECGRSVGDVVAVGVVDVGAEGVILLLSLGEFFKDQGFKFLKLFITVTLLLAHSGCVLGSGNVDSVRNVNVLFV